MFSKLVRLGKDAELATTPTNKQVCKITAAYDVGYGDSKKTVWIQASFWGERGAKLAQYLLKGNQIVIHADNVEPNAFQGNNGLSVSLRMDIVNIELIAKGVDTHQSNAQSKPKPTPVATPSYTAPQSSGFSDFDDDILF